MSTYADLIRRVRRRVGDRPTRVLVQDDPLSATASSLTIRSTDADKFKQAGIELCFDDGTDELVITNAAVDSATNTVGIDRGQDGTTAADHQQNVAALLRPRFDNATYIDNLNYMIADELWPDVWEAKESTLTYQSANEYYSPSVTDIEELVYAYQIISGTIVEIKAEFLSPGLADNTNFPNGAILIRETGDSSTIYFAYRARPTLASLTSGLEHLVVLGAAAQLVLAEEARHVGGGTTAIERRVQDGSRLRAGVISWEQFTHARTKERIRLAHEEQLARHKLFGVR